MAGTRVGPFILLGAVLLLVGCGGGEEASDISVDDVVQALGL